MERISHSEGHTYAAIDLKSFYASVECVDRDLDPLTARLVVADPTRTDKTICLAVTPALKAYGISGRARVFEVNHRLEEVKKGIANASAEEVKASLLARDRIDSTRKYAPLRKADGVIEIDSTELTLEQVVETVLAALPKGWVQA